jgi:AAA family ATP:ADP antiporter
MEAGGGLAAEGLSLQGVTDAGPRDALAPAPLGFRLLRRAVEVELGEVRPTLLACAYFFCSLSSWFVLRPIRDEIAVAAGVRNLPWMFAGTLVVTLIANALYSGLVARLPVRRFITVTYQALVVCLVLFWFFWRRGGEGAEGTSTVWTARFFYAWTSMYAVFVTSLFWSVMADAFRSGQAKRLFGFIGVGGTIGSITGSALTAALARVLGPTNLLFVSVVLLELAAVLAIAFYAAVRGTARDEADADARADASDAAGEPAMRGAGRRTIGGSVWAGATHVFRNRYLLGIAGFILLYNVGSTVLYFAQTEVVGAAYTSREARTEILARVEFLTQLLTAITQAFLTGRIIRWLGLGVTLALMPAVSILGFAAIGATAWGIVPALSAVLGFAVLRRATNFSLTNPAMEALFTVVSREDKYKAKVFIETFVYRAADQLAAWGYAGLALLGLTIVGISWVTVPISGLFLALGLWLGWRQRALAAREEQARPPVAPPAGVLAAPLASSVAS